jgi:hypothetical protein
MDALDFASAVDAGLLAVIAVLWSCSQKNRQEK